MDTSLLDRLCAAYGVASGRRHPTGEQPVLSTDQQWALLAALDPALADPTQAEQRLMERERGRWSRLLPPVQVLRRTDDAPRIDFTVAAERVDQPFEWTLSLESGERRQGRVCPRELAATAQQRLDGRRYRRYSLALPENPDCGYHRFSLQALAGTELRGDMSLIVTPAACYQPDALAAGERWWGVAAPLYAVRSHRNWGVGDFTDLQTLVDIAAGLDAATLSLGPAHALFFHQPRHASPYKPSSRLFLNILYLDVEAIPGFADCAAVQEMMAKPQFQARLRALRAAELVDYAGVTEVKCAVLRELYRDFRAGALTAGGAEAEAFRAFQAAGGAALRRHAVFEALQQYFHEQNPAVNDWLDWPAGYDDPNSIAVAAFMQDQRERIEFYEYLQWQAARQREAVGRRAQAGGLQLGICQELAVSVDHHGAEAWADQSLYALPARIGAPTEGATHNLGLFASPASRDKQLIERVAERARLLLALEREGLLPEGVSVDPASTPEMTPALALATQRLLARSPARLMLTPWEDLLTQAQQAQQAGSGDRYPNWRHKLASPLEEAADHPQVKAIAAAIKQERSGAPPPAGSPSAPPAVIPRATYRLQFHSGFTFTQATQLVPYLAALGVSHVYASPYLKARPGSTHGYDIVDHNALNPEIGSEEEYERFCQTLRRHGLGQILDIVPNHVGVMGSDNEWWLDVLENGQAAVHAPYFDIDWSPLNKALRDKVLVPILGDQYGVVLENGELRLAFQPDGGAFAVHYYDHTFPIDPRTYPRILGARLESLVARLGEADTDLLVYQSLITAFGHLPAREEPSPEARAVRARDKELHKRQLAELCRRSPDVAALIEETCQAFNGAPGNPDSFDALHQLLEGQAYRLASWRVAGDDINYRRFFDINDLAALRMEDERVFQDTHRKILELLSQGVLHGLRIDHPDGLYDPKGYFQRLQESMATVAGAGAAGVDADHKPLYVVVEKILETYERLPKDWPVHGTTGYEFGNLLNGLLVDGAAEQQFTDIYADFIGERIDFEELLYDCKKLIIYGPLFSELNVLANQLSRIALADRRTRDFTVNSLRQTLAEIVAHFPVYRTYITAAGLTEKDREYINWAVSVARKLSQDEDVSVFDFIRDVLLTDAAADKSAAFRAAVLAFAMKFQQYTGPLMAKGLEDTSFYRYYRLASLNEVGGDPRRFGVSVTGFHHANQQRVRDWPHAMLTTSTHDSKRSEDVRARINVLSELPEEWERQLQRWSRLNAAKKRLVNDQPAPSANDEYLLYQILLGAWPTTPLDEQGWRTFRGRIENYMLKAIKEAKQHTSWINPNAEYEKAVTDFVAALLGEPDKNRFLADFLPLQQRIARFGLFNSLSQTLLKLTSPGVPDIYQGNELWDFSLVDPDNRRPVDYERRCQLLEMLQPWADLPAADLTARPRELLDTLEDGRAKLYMTWRTLQLRRRCEAVFRDGDYQPLTATGARDGHVCAFARRGENATVVVVAPVLSARLLDGDAGRLPLGPEVWGDTRLTLPSATAQRFVNVFDASSLTSKPAEGATTLPLAAVLQHFPVAALVSAD